MSAYVVSDRHINTLVQALAHDPYRSDLTLPSGITLNVSQSPEDRQTVAQILLDENVRSFNSRYPSHASAPARIRYQSQPPVDAVTILKACECYDYQASETEDYKDTDAAHLIAHLRIQTIRTLPGYNEAPWGLD